MTAPAGATKQEIARYPYFNRDGVLLYEVVRFNPKAFAQCRPSGVAAAGTGALPPGGTVWGLRAGYYVRDGALDWKAAPEGASDAAYLEECPRVLFNLAAVLAATDVLLLEGEKDVLAATELGFVATTNPQGAGNFRKEFAAGLRGKNVTIVPDLDDAGRKHGDKVARILQGVASLVKILLLPFSEHHPGKDLSDWIAVGGTAEQLVALIEQAPEAPSGQDEDGPDAGNASTQAKQSTMLAGLCTDVELFHTQDDRQIAVIQVGGHREVWPVRSQRFKHFLVGRFFEAEGKAPSAEAMRETLDLFSARAQYHGPQCEAGTRILRSGGNLYINLADDEWRVIEITPSGVWRIVAKPPVLFIRPRGMDSLPMPTVGGDLRELKSLLHVNEEHFILIIAWLIGAFHPDGPYPIIALNGEHGSAKSTTAKALKQLNDPSCPLLRTPPRDERDLINNARNSWVIAHDNVSDIQPWLSDALCRLSTGGGFGTRQLYTDDEEILFNGKRPILLNGISDICNAPDLADRAIVLTLPPIPEEERLTEKNYWNRFEQLKSGIFGAVLDAVATAHANIGHTTIARPPRMADFSNWVAAAAPALPFSAEEFLRIYRENRRESTLLALESSALASAVLRLMEEEGSWEGRYGELLGKLNEKATASAQNSKKWPKNARALSSYLRRFAPPLRAAGCFIDELARDPVTKAKRIIIRRGVADSNKQTKSDPTTNSLPGANSMESDLDSMVEEVI